MSALRRFLPHAARSWCQPRAYAGDVPNRFNEYWIRGRVFLRTIFKRSNKRHKDGSIPITVSRFGAYGGAKESLVSRIIRSHANHGLASRIGLVHHWRAFSSRGTSTLLGLTGLVLVQKPSFLTEEDESKAACSNVWDMFKPVALDALSKREQVEDNEAGCRAENKRLSDLQIGKFLGKGANASVYSAKWKNTSDAKIGAPKQTPFPGLDVIEEDADWSNVNRDEVKYHQNHFDDRTGSTSLCQLITDNKALQPYDLCVKHIFNYSIASNAFEIERAFNAEAIPMKLTLWGRTHPNIAELQAKFTARVVPLPGERQLCPAALPARSFPGGCGRNMTMYVVMKRYHGTLRQYLDYLPLLMSKTSQTEASGHVDSPASGHIDSQPNAAAAARSTSGGNDRVDADDESSFVVLPINDFDDDLESVSAAAQPQNAAETVVDSLRTGKMTFFCYKAEDEEPLSMPELDRNSIVPTTKSLIETIQTLNLTGDTQPMSKGADPDTLALALLTQLMDSVAFLHRNQVAHRDIKTDNVLVDLSQGVDQPVLKLSDFGCAVDSLRIPYQSDLICPGGNPALMPPEVVNAKPHLLAELNYQRADLWSAATLAYDIFGQSNPFWVSLYSGMYSMDELPELSERAPKPVRRIIRQCLNIDPKKRPHPEMVAAVCHLCLIMRTAPPVLSHVPQSGKPRHVCNWIALLLADTMLRLRNVTSDWLLLRMRVMFFTTLPFSRVLNAVEFISACE